MAGRPLLLLLLCVCTGLCIAVPRSQDPLCGMKIRITSNCLNYANKVLIDNLITKTKGTTIADVNHKGSHLSFELTNVYLSEFSVPNSKVTLLQDKGIQWSARDVFLSVHTDYHYHYENKILRFIPVKISDHGGLDVRLSGGSFDVRIKMGVDKNERPSIATTSCHCNIDSVRVKFSGGSVGTTIYNLFRGLIESYMKNVLEQNLCDSINKVINEDTERSLQRVHISTKIGPKFRLNYGLVSAPVFHTDSMESFHKGIIYFMDKIEPVPFDPSPFPSNSSTGKMVYLWVSGYMFHSLSYQAQKHDILKRTLTNDDFDDAFLNTSCKFGSMCIGKFIPQLNHNFPNEAVQIDLMSRKAPNIALVQGELRLIMNGRMVLYVKQPSASERRYLFTMDTDLTAAITASYSNGYLHSKLKRTKFDVCISNSTMHPIYERALNFIMQNIVKHFLQPALDDMGTTGFPLIRSDDLKLTNTDIQLSQDVLIIGTDLEVIKD